jgi:hypothetical protein
VRQANRATTGVSAGNMRRHSTNWPTFAPFRQSFRQSLLGRAQALRTSPRLSCLAPPPAPRAGSQPMPSAANVCALRQCFCGCGQKVGKLKRTSANGAGRKITALLALIEQDVHPAPGVSLDDPKLKGFVEMVAQTKQDGEAFAQDCRLVVHGDMAFGEADWSAIRAWTKNTEGMTNFFRMSSEQQERIMRSG